MARWVSMDRLSPKFCQNPRDSSGNQHPAPPRSPVTHGLVAVRSRDVGHARQSYSGLVRDSTRDSEDSYQGEDSVARSMP